MNTSSLSHRTSLARLVLHFSNNRPAAGRRLFSATEPLDAHELTGQTPEFASSRHCNDEMSLLHRVAKLKKP
jgi:hypothetical protein